MFRRGCTSCPTRGEKRKGGLSFWDKGDVAVSRIPYGFHPAFFPLRIGRGVLFWARVCFYVGGAIVKSVEKHLQPELLYFCPRFKYSSSLALYGLGSRTLVCNVRYLPGSFHQNLRKEDLVAYVVGLCSIPVLPFLLIHRCPVAPTTHSAESLCLVKLYRTSSGTCLPK